MKRTSRLPISIIVILALSFVLTQAVQARNYYIQDYIFLSPGQSQQREFTVYDVFSLRELSPVESFVVVATGEAGILDISLQAAPELSFGERVDYVLFAFGYSLDEGPFVVYKSASTPYSVSSEAVINAPFGFAVVSVIVQDYIGDDDTIFPCPFAIAFSLSEEESSE